jgi:hypothetical protein
METTKMPTFEVDEDLARLVEKLANPAPFENLTFSDGLRRVLNGLLRTNGAKPPVDLDELLAESMALSRGQPKKAPSPNARHWADSVAELKRARGLSSWKAICDHLKIKTGGDSARRKLAAWVKENKPDWPEVPEVGAE